MNTIWRISLATQDDQAAVTDLIEDRARWLRTQKSTTQWQRPWPDAEGRYKRISDGLLGGHTWIAWAEGRPVATVTIYLEGNPELWSKIDRKTEAVYLHRLVVDQSYAGTGRGAELINWAAKKGKKRNPYAELIRLDAWSDNKELHAYYLGQGFTFIETRETSDNCPSGSVFEKQIQAALNADTSRFAEDPPITHTFDTRVQAYASW